jgi:membrane-associated phospholipid phosphatase
VIPSVREGRIETPASAGPEATRPWWVRHWPVDVVGAIAGVVFAAVELLASRANPGIGWQGPIELLTCTALWLAMPAILRRLPGAPNPGLAVFLRCQLFVVTMLFAFTAMGPVIPALRHGSYEPMLAQIDLDLLGFHPSVWFGERQIPIVTDILQILYTSYYFFLLVIVVMPLLRGDLRGTSRALVLISLALYLNFILYLLLPARSPWMTNDWPEASYLAALPRYAAPLEGSGVFRFINYIIANATPNPLDVFPSGHVGNTTALLWFIARYERRWLPFIFLFWITILVATLYLRYHYVVDFLGGIAYAIIANGVAIRVDAWWRRRMGDG